MREKESTIGGAKNSEALTALRKDIDKRFADLNSKISDSLMARKKVVQEDPCSRLRQPSFWDDSWRVIRRKEQGLATVVNYKKSSRCISPCRLASRSYLTKLVRNAAKLLIAIVAGITFPVLGLIFFLVGSVFLLSQAMRSWLAWQIIGIIVIFTGALLIVLTVRR